MKNFRIFFQDWAGWTIKFTGASEPWTPKLTFEIMGAELAIMNQDGEL